MIKENDIVRVTDDRSVHHGQAGQVIYPSEERDEGGPTRNWVQFFCGPYSSGHVSDEHLDVIDVDKLTDEEAAVLMRWELLK